jgi:hypothetical protein
MAYVDSALVSFTLPLSYADGTTPWPAANYGGATVFRNGTQIGTVVAPALTYNDTTVPVGKQSYTVEVTDSVTGLTSAASVAVTYTQAGQPPGAPTITSIVAG